MTPQESYKLGFLLRCAEEGLDKRATARRVKAAAFMQYMAKEAQAGGKIDKIMSGGKAIGGTITEIPGAMENTVDFAIKSILLGGGLGLAGGTGLGYLASKLLRPVDRTPHQQAQHEQTAAHYRALDRLRAAYKAQQQNTG